MKQATADLGRMLTGSYADIGILLRVMWPTVLIAAIVTTIESVALNYAVPTLIHAEAVQAVAGTLISIAVIWIVAPYEVAQLRFLIGGEPAVALPPFLARGSEVQLYFAWAASLRIVATLPTILGSLSTAPGTVDLTLLGGTFLVWFLFLSLTTLLPAIAMGRAPSIVQAARESRGHLRFIAAATLLSALPIWIAGVAIALASGVNFLMPHQTAGLSPPVWVLGAAFALINTTVAARLYRRYASGAGNTLQGQRERAA